jgi:hypothetical protein
MRQPGAPGHSACDVQSATETLDKAQGILIALRRCDPGAAFVELVDAAIRYQRAVPSVAAALVGMSVDGRGVCDGRATDAAHCEWGVLLTDHGPTCPGVRFGNRTDDRG